MKAIITIIDDYGNLIEANRLIKHSAHTYDDFYETFHFDYHVSVKRGLTLNSTAGVGDNGVALK